MVTGDDPAGAVHNLKDYIVHTHAKDGKQNYYVDPDIIYGMIESHIVTADSFIEVPLGEGSVNWDEYLKALEDILFGTDEAEARLPMPNEVISLMKEDLQAAG